MIRVEFYNAFKFPKYDLLILHQEVGISDNCYVIQSEMNIELYQLLLSTRCTHKHTILNFVYYLSENEVEQTVDYILDKYYSSVVQNLQDICKISLTVPDTKNDRQSDLFEYFKLLKRDYWVDGMQCRLQNILKKKDIDSVYKFWSFVLRGLKSSLTNTSFDTDISTAITFIGPLFAKPSNLLIQKAINDMLPLLDMSKPDANILYVITIYLNILKLGRIVKIVDDSNTQYKLLGKKIFLVVKVKSKKLSKNQKEILDSIKEHVEVSDDYVPYAYNLVIVKNIKSLNNVYESTYQRQMHLDIRTIDTVCSSEDQYLDNFDIEYFFQSFHEWNFNTWIYKRKKNIQPLMVLDLDNAIELEMKKHIYLEIKHNTNQNFNNICATLRDEDLIHNNKYINVYSTIVNGIDYIVKTGKIKWCETDRALKVSKLASDGICTFFPLVVATGVCSKTTIIPSELNIDSYNKEAKHFMAMEEAELTLHHFFHTKSHDSKVYSRIFCQIFYSMFCMRKYAGFVHANLCPDNLMIDHSQNLVIIDFSDCTDSYAKSNKCFTFLLGLMEVVQHTNPKIYTLLSLLTRRVINAYRTSTFPDDFEYQLMLIVLQNSSSD